MLACELDCNSVTQSSPDHCAGLWGLPSGATRQAGCVPHNPALLHTNRLACLLSISAQPVLAQIQLVVNNDLLSKTRNMPCQHGCEQVGVQYAALQAVLESGFGQVIGTVMRQGS